MATSRFAENAALRDRVNNVTAATLLTVKQEVIQEIERFSFRAKEGLTVAETKRKHIMGVQKITTPSRLIEYYYNSLLAGEKMPV